MPKVTIILTCYNKPETVGKAIESVINQTFQDWELLIMNDNSNLKTTKIIKSYLNDQRIHYYNSEIKDGDRYKTTRYATLINEAISLSTGKYLSYLTDDSEYLPERLEVMSEYLDTHPDIHIVYSKQITRKLNENHTLIFQSTRQTKGVLRKAANLVDHCSVMHTRKAMEVVKEKYNNYWDDDPKHWHNADAVAWARLNEFYLFHPLEKTLDISYKTPYSFQTLNLYIPEKIPDGVIIKGLSPDVYLVDKQKRRKITEGMFDKLKYKKGKIIKIPDPFVFKYPLGSPIDDTILKNGKIPNQLLIKSSNSPNIYYIQNGKKRMIVNAQAMKRYHFKHSDIVLLDPVVIQRLPDGPPLGMKIMSHTKLPDGALFTCKGKFYISENNCLYPIYYKCINRLKYSMNDIVKLHQHELDYFKQGPLITWNHLKK
ncbi:glycosyltransferase family 2 protein [Alkalihalobacterium elongatum]|uniref:glycosyltransferase family 2 protein n=1 Tax=Alkalihalobacterium elongatum TaxID=2675466 RepID=UPI001C1F5243|nr:glycosyltransferase family 2 protein [Alkalihalobacterium elongatum]